MSAAGLSYEVRRVLKRYRFGLDGFGLGLFLLIMAPNVIWAVLPASVDPLRQPSATPVLDQAASVVQALLVAALCLIKNRRAESILKYPSAAAGIVLCGLGYWMAWGCYYWGKISPALLLAMCLLPCASLLIYAAGRRNWPALAFGGIFAVLHALYGVVNFYLSYIIIASATRKKQLIRKSSIIKALKPKTLEESL